MAFTCRCVVLHYSGRKLLIRSAVQTYRRIKSCISDQKKFKKKHNLLLSLPSNHTTVAAMLCIFLISTFSSSKHQQSINQSLSFIIPFKYNNILPRLHLFLFLFSAVHFFQPLYFVLQKRRLACLSSLLKPPSPSLPHLLGFPATDAGLQRGSTAISSDYVIF